MSKPFADLIDDAQVSAVMLGIEAAILASFVSRPMRAMTESAVKERFGMCERIFRTLRGEYKWSVSRCVDHLPAFLVKDLDQEPWKPDARGVWMPGDEA